MKYTLSIIMLATTLHLVSHSQEKGLVFAHRGGAFEFEENTLFAFKSSYEKGLRGFETDVRLTSDGDLVILHDDSLDRVYQATGAAEHKTMAELKQVKTKKGNPMLTLDELLDYFKDKPNIYLEFEMKTGNKKLYPDEAIAKYCQTLYDRVMAARPEGSYYVFTSFDQRPLKAINKIDPNADTLFITGGPLTPEVMKIAKDVGARRIGCIANATTRAQVRAAQKEGFKVTVWPGHSIDDYMLGIGLGADALCSDIPVKVLEWKKKLDALK